MALQAMMAATVMASTQTEALPMPPRNFLVKLPGN